MPFEKCTSIWRGILSSIRPTLAAQKPRSAIQVASTAKFSSSQIHLARRKGGPKPDPRIRNIRYYLLHPKTPRVLRFSRERHLRHWTIHRAWQLYQSHLRRDRELELERQFNCMRDACEALRLMDGNGNTEVGAASADGLSMTKPKADQTDVGRLFRKAMHKGDTWKGVPIEYARLQTDMPGSQPWDESWTR